MSKKIHFVSGLPRSCSTLLCNLLAQNPKIHATQSSALHEIGYLARQVYHVEEAKAVDMEKVLEPMYSDYVKAGCENAYNRITDRPVVVDKSRAWISSIDLVFSIWPNAKILVPVRDVRGIICSMEKKRIKHPSFMNGVEQQDPSNWTTMDKRAQAWLQSPPVGIAIERLYEAVNKYKDKLMFVNAKNLTEDTQSVMNSVWEYLEEDSFVHDTSNVEQYTQEYDVGFPYGDHVIRQEVAPLINDWHEILGRELSEQIRTKFEWINNL
jgi:sulfotransferase